MMTRQAKNNKDNEFKNVWKKNGIPTLEYCSIERAAQLLDCEKSDIIHWLWTMKIRLAVYIKEPISAEFTAMETINDNNPIVFDGFSVPEGTFTRVDVESKSIFGDFHDRNGLNIITKGECKISEVCFPSPTMELHDGKLTVTPVDSFFIKLASKRFYMECIAKNSMGFQENDIVIIAEDIDRIFIAGKEGCSLGRPILFKNPITETIEISEVRETVHQSDMIVDLLNLLGISMEETANNPAEINKKLRSLANKKNIKCREPDAKTWDRWIAKVRK